MVDSINATPSSASANSYATAAQLATYNANHIAAATSDVYDSATTDQRAQAAIMATRLLDEWVDWSGAKATKTQALRWPRYGVLDRDGYQFDGDSIPKFLYTATAELVRLLLTNGDPTADPETLGFSNLKVGPLELTVDVNDRDRYGSIPDSVRAMIEPYGTVRSKTNSGSFKVVRT